MITEKSTMDKNIPAKEQMMRKTKRYAIYAAIVAIVAVGIACIGTLFTPTITEKSITIEEAKRGTIETSIMASGNVVPAFEEVITSPISTKILEVFLHSGDTVDVGTPIMRLDLQAMQTEYAKQLDEQEVRDQQMVQLVANIETSLSDKQMRIEVEEMRIEQLEAQLRNEMYLDSLGSGTKDRVRQAETALKTARLEIKQLKQQYVNEKRVKEAEMKVQSLRNNIADKNLSETRRTLDGANIRSPRKATLTYLNTDIGAQIGAGTKIATVSDLSHFKIECEIGDIYSEKIKAGGIARVKVGREMIDGTISSVTPMSRNGMITFTVALENDNHPRLRSGLKTEVHVVTSIKDDVLYLKNGAYYKGKGKYDVFVEQEDKTLTRREVEFGESNYELVEILSGIEEGERVVISDMTNYAHSKLIKIEEK